MRRTPRRESTVYSVTSAPMSLRADQQGRIRQYLISMSIRTGCFLLAIVASGVTRWVCVVLACVLPYVAVVFANAARVRRVGSVPILPPPTHAQRALHSAPRRQEPHDD